MADLKKSKAWWPLIWAVILTLLYKLGDGFVVANLILSPEKVVTTMVYLTLGGLIGLGINYFLCQTPLGRLVDKSYTSIHGMSVKAHKVAFLTGSLSAVATGFYLFAMTMLDPSLVVPFTSLAVVFISIADAVKGRIEFKSILLPLVLVLLGVAISSIMLIMANWAAVVGVLALILLGNNGFSAASEVVSKDGLDASDSISFGFWRFFWLTISGIIISLIVATVLGHLTLYFSVLLATLQSLKFCVTVSLIMVVVFFAQASGNLATTLSDPTTKNLVMTVVIVLSVFATLFASTIFPTVFVMTRAISLTEWILRIIGAMVLFLGILLLKKNS